MSRTCSTSVAGDDDDLPPPPPPTPVELMAILAEGQCTMAEALCTIANRYGRGARQGPKPNQYIDFKDFLDTKPPIFKDADEPLQADEWLNTLEQKFRLLRLTEVLKTEYASHQLHGPAGIGGAIIGPLCPLMPKSLGISSSMLSGEIIFLLVSWQSSIRSS